MSDIDVSTEIDIAASPTDVAAVMFDPARETEWMKAVGRVEVVEAALAPGARVRHFGSFLGMEISWTTVVETVHFPHVLALRIEGGPFVGTVRYEVQRAGAGTRARIRNVGRPTAFGFLPASLISGKMQSALQADLERLKALVEGSHT